MKRFSILAALAVSDLGTGFLLQAFVLLTVGIGVQTDAYFAGQAAPLVLLAILQLPLQRAVVVAFSKYSEGRFPAVRLISALVVATGFVLLILGVAAPSFMRIVYPNLPAPAQDLGVAVLRTQCAAVMFSCANLVLLALNQTQGRFVRCELSVLASTLAAACFVFFAVKPLGIISAAYGQIIKAILSTLLLGWMLRNSLSLGVPPWKEIKDVLRPLVSAGIFTKLAPIIDRSIASAAPGGAMSVLVFGQSMYNAATGIAERSIVAPRLPALKRGLASISPMRVAMQLAAAGLALVVVMISATLLAMHIPAINQKAGEDVLTLLATVLIGLAGFPIAALTVQWIAAAVVVLGRPDLSGKIVAGGFLVGVAFKYLGFHVGGIHGLSVGISLYYLLNALAFLFVLRHMMRAAPAAD